MARDAEMMAVCGLDCGSCDIRLVPADREAAERVAAWFRDNGWLAEDEGPSEILNREMYCTGCRGGRDIHWAADCELLLCCVDEKGLDSCAHCPEFACDRLEAFENDGYRHHKEAVERLRRMAAA